MKSRNEIYEAVTNQIIQQLEQGTIPWQREWAGNVAGPFNFKTGKAYRGINYWNLSSYEYQSPAWLTWNQIQQLKLKVRKGSKSADVLFWKLLEVIDVTGEKKRIPYPRIYHVFNTEQIEGLEYKPNECPYEQIRPCEEIVEAFADKPPIYNTSRDGCYYAPLKDEVHMIPPSNFNSSEAYYVTLFHELTHSTGHSKRLNRGLDIEPHRFGDPVYSKEELVAEMGAAHLCGLSGISNTTIQNSAAYIENWLRVFKNDRAILIQASQTAQKAVDYMLGHLHPAEPAEAESQLVSTEV